MNARSNIQFLTYCAEGDDRGICFSCFCLSKSFQIFILVEHLLYLLELIIWQDGKRLVAIAFQYIWMQSQHFDSSCSSVSIATMHNSINNNLILIFYLK